MANGCTEAGQSITDVTLSFPVHHFDISQTWKQFQTSQTVVRRLVAGFPKVMKAVKDRFKSDISKLH